MANPQCICQFGNHTLPEIHLPMTSTSQVTGLFLNQATYDSFSARPHTRELIDDFRSLGNLFIAPDDNSLPDLMERVRSAP